MISDYKIIVKWYFKDIFNHFLRAYIDKTAYLPSLFTKLYEPVFLTISGVYW